VKFGGKRKRRKERAEEERSKNLKKEKELLG
jgi:hypothetical protein